MRMFTVGLALLVATGCTTDQVSFTHASELQTQARGVALLDDADVAQVGMSANTCEVQTSSGVIGADSDVAVGEDDNVQDAVGSNTVVVGTAGIYVIDRNFGGIGEPQVRLSNVAQSRLLSDGTVVALHGTESTCAVDWQGGGRVDIAGGCGGTLAVDRATGKTFVANGAGLTIVDPSGASLTVEGAFDLVAYDETADLVYAGTLGDSEVRALDTNGVVQWASDLGGSITAIDDMGPTGAVAVTFDNGNTESSGNLVVLDVSTGDQISNIPLPSAPNQVLVGNNGASMAMVLEREVHFFAVDLSAE